MRSEVELHVHERGKNSSILKAEGGGGICVCISMCKCVRAHLQWH